MAQKMATMPLIRRLVSDYLNTTHTNRQPSIIHIVVNTDLSQCYSLSCNAYEWQNTLVHVH